MSNGGLTALLPNAFSSLTSLLLLDVGGNDMESETALKAASFTGLGSLTSLSLASGSYGGSVLEAKFFSQLTSLQSLYASCSIFFYLLVELMYHCVVRHLNRDISLSSLPLESVEIISMT